MKRYLAQFNMARLVAPRRHSRVAEFMENLERVNGVGRRSPGFVWLLEGGEGAAAINGDARLIPNLSVWEDVASLRDFVFETIHKHFFERSAEWFEAPDGPRFVMWWIDADHRPSLTEGVERLSHLREKGASDYAFGWSHVNNDAATGVQV